MMMFSHESPLPSSSANSVAMICPETFWIKGIQFKDDLFSKKKSKKDLENDTSFNLFYSKERDLGR